MGNFDIFSQFGSTQDTSYNLLTLSYGIYSCRLQCKVPRRFFIFSNVLKPDKQEKNLLIFSY